LYLPENEIFMPKNMGRLEMIGNNTTVGGFKLTEATKPNDTYTASSKLNAFYLMLDNRYKFLRLIWGVRYEGFQQFLDAKRSTNKEDDVHLNIIKNDVLPSANLVVALNKKQNIRLAYSQTVNRPEYRELAPFAFYDFNTKLVVTGYDSLKRALIHNADIRYEVYPGRGQLFSVSGFYKKFINPIEQILSSYTENEITYENLPSAKNYGAELEFRILLAALFKKDSVKILNNITAFSNLSIIRSTVNTGNRSGIGGGERPLQGQSPYVFNAGMQYISEKKGVSASLSFNRVGSRIYVVGNENEAAIWEAPRSFLDFQLAKSLCKNKIEIKLNAQNILAQRQVFYQNKIYGEANDKKGLTASVNSIVTGDAQNKTDYNKKVDDLIWSTKFGAVYSIAVSIKL
jgi:outer membrane receptor protein involved in Fe transport